MVCYYFLGKLDFINWQHYDVNMYEVNMIMRCPYVLSTWHQVIWDTAGDWLVGEKMRGVGCVRFFSRHSNSSSGVGQSLFFNSIGVGWSSWFQDIQIWAAREVRQKIQNLAARQSGAKIPDFSSEEARFQRFDFQRRPSPVSFYKNISIIIGRSSRFFCFWFYRRWVYFYQGFIWKFHFRFSSFWGYFHIFIRRSSLGSFLWILTIRSSVLSGFS